MNIKTENFLFTCQQSGNCCCDPKLIVTLTYRDIYRLYTVLSIDFNQLIQKITFYTLDSTPDSELLDKMVLKALQTSEGAVIPGLRKLENGTCVFYHRPNCTIYSDRPLACRNYPFAFIKNNSEIQVVWVKNALKSCKGIGIGSPTHYEVLIKQGKNYFKEIKIHNELINNLSIEASQGQPLTAREALWIIIIFAENNLKKSSKF